MYYYQMSDMLMCTIAIEAVNKVDVQWTEMVKESTA